MGVLSLDLTILCMILVGNFGIDVCRPVSLLAMMGGSRLLCAEVTRLNPISTLLDRLNARCKVCVFLGAVRSVGDAT